MTIAGNVVDLIQTARPPRAFRVEWLDADTYVDLRTGEICEASHSETRGDRMSIPEMRRTLRRMRGLINANWRGENNELLVTLTYSENMQDQRKLATDLDRFNKRMKRKLGHVKYLAAVEPQARGAWHTHILIKQLTSYYTYWPHEEVAEIWPHGEIIDVQRLKAVDNVGAYLSAYLSNMPADEAEAAAPREILREAGSETLPKGVVKGARLKMYPRGMHLYRASQNLEKPIIKKIRPISAEMEALLENGDIRYTSQLELLGTDQNDEQRNYLINRIAQMQINLKHTSEV